MPGHAKFLEKSPAPASRGACLRETAPQMGVDAPRLASPAATGAPSGSGEAGGVQALQRLVGNQAVMRLLDAQRAGGDLREPSDKAIRVAAAEGVRTPSTSLPYLTCIQASFGRHSIGDIQAHVGPAASRTSQAMSAQAYATGNHVVFGVRPDLRTAAHEAAHIVQQRAGVQLAAGIGHAGDRYERHADAVADAVVAGVSAEGMLETLAASADESQRGASDRLGTFVASSRTNTAPQLREAGGLFQPQRIVAHRGMRPKLPGRAVQRLRQVTNLSTQVGGTCGCYSLVMAIEALNGGALNLQNGETLPRLVTKAAIESGSMLGEIFTFNDLAKVVNTVNEKLNPHRIGKKVIIERQEFNDAKTLRALIERSGPDEVLMIAYNASRLSRKPSDHPSQSAHWSLIESLTGEKVKLANPWGRHDEIGLQNLHKGNSELGAPFNWQIFAGEVLNRPSWMQDLDSFATGAHAPSVENLFENLSEISRKQWVERLDLRGYVVKITWEDESWTSDLAMFAMPGQYEELVDAFADLDPRAAREFQRSLRQPPHQTGLSKNSKKIKKYDSKEEKSNKRSGNGRENTTRKSR